MIGAPAKPFSTLRLLIVDDEPDVRHGLARLAGKTGMKTSVAADGEEALLLMEKEPADIIISDVMMPNMNGLDLLRQIRARWPETAVILITGFGTIEMAVECLQHGASHFIPKPFDNRDILDAVERVGSTLLAGRSTGRPTGPATPGAPPAVEAERPLIAADPGMKPVLALIQQVAPTTVPVLIEGESGTGKELVAREIHRLGPTSDEPFLAVNCAALPDTLLESELFGYMKGAFTGAAKNHDGIFRQAGGGTVFLDEIASMSLAFQGKLLRVLQERVVRPLGGVQDEPVAFRLLSATNRSLPDLIRQGLFRDDLYYRLRVITVPIPPLRERPADVPLLAERFLEKAAREFLPPGTPPPILSTSAIASLQSHAWPGNVRELQNAIQRAVIVSGGAPIEARHLDLAGSGGFRAPLVLDMADYESAKQRAVEEFQRQFVTQALEKHHGNVSHAASACGLTRAALQRIMRSLAIHRDDYVEE